MSVSLTNRLTKTMFARQRDAYLLDVRTLIVLQSLGNDWRKAQELTPHLGQPWRRIAFSLRRLCRRGVVEQRVVAYRGKHRTKEYTTQYRPKTQNLGDASFIARYMPWLIGGNST